MDNLDDLRVESQFESYSVIFSESLDSAILRLKQSEDEIFFLIDEVLIRTHPQLILSLRRPFLALRAEESQKTIQVAADVYQWLLEQGATKASVVVAIGGGIVQDLATFVSATYYRGIRWHLLPTTLLSMSDSCIGGKCALNQGGFKNQVGVIWPPKSVIVAPDFLQTLPTTHVKSGYGEMLKLSLTGGHEFYDEFKDFVRKHGFTKDGVLGLIRASLRAKTSVIEEDETETGLRRILNYGHTFGHALEAATDNKVTHGEAIVMGMDLVNFLGVEYGITEQSFANDFHSFAMEYFDLSSLKKQAEPYSAELFQLTFRDKKVLSKKLHLALAVRPGKLVVHAVDLDQSLQNLIKKYLNG